MMAVHELGHVIGAVISGGVVERVVLHPLTISRTDVSPNPHPSFVVWLGPVIGCLFPLALAWSIPRRLMITHSVAKFFAGFCLVAKGTYIAIGSLDRIGDCGVMLDNGSPRWLLVAFGVVTVPVGLYVWHRIGSLRTFAKTPEIVSPRWAYALAFVLLAVVITELLLSPR
jgi:hypothetical protein